MWLEIKDVHFVKSAQTNADFPADGLPHVVVAGRSNVGKSSLLNLLTGRKQLVKTSRQPGKTRLINFFLVNPAGPPESTFYLVDIPGFGYARAGREEKRMMEGAINGYLRGCKGIAGLLYLVDVRLPGSEVDKQALEWLKKFDFPLLVVATKADKLNRARIRPALDEIARRHKLPQPPLLTSSLQKSGRKEILEQIGLLLGKGSGIGDSSQKITA